jgi:antibiotic biosynthesis monooxygenase (ABM) superfamily enzyme
VTDASASVTVSITRTVDPARITESSLWVQEGMDRASRYPGFLGSGWVRASQDSGNWHMLYRFSNPELLDAWESSAERTQWLCAGRDLVLESRAEKRTGIEGWFDTPQGPAGSPDRSASAGPPPRWKQTVAIGLGLFPLNLCFTLLMSATVPGWDHVAPVLKIFLTTAILTPIMAYLVLPWITRMLRPWLHRPPVPPSP